LSEGKVGAASRRWILVADDDPAVRELWVESLTRAGYRVLSADNGLDALGLMQAIVPDLMILDLRMPGLSGEDILRELRGSATLRRIPVLIISGFLDSDSSVGDGLNIVARLPKPIRVRSLLEAVAAGLSPRYGEGRSAPAGSPDGILPTLA
jgi:DNA-binding response OmpR family regulator